MITKFLQFLEEGGQAAGKLELVKTDVETAYAHAKKVFKKEGRDLDKDLPNFKDNYLLAQTQAGGGTTKRKDMPVLDEKDLKKFQKRLQNGDLDVESPYGDVTDDNNHFPEHLGGKKAKDFVEAGKKKHDGSKPDDKVKVTKTKETVSDLKPIQQQIYFDKSIGMTGKSGVAKSKAFLSKNSFVISSDNRIIDGHHRFLTALLIDPKMKVPVFKINLPMNELLKLSLAYGDAVGNTRNA